MPAYFASDVHLRLDHPDRGARFARFVGSLRPSDPLTIVGDLCDFWFASRQRRAEAEADPIGDAGLRALADYRAGGGDLSVLLGNHDAWLGPFYESTLGARIRPEPLDLDISGLRLRLVHGHRLGARSPWKAVMESRAFLAAFGATPGPVAGALGRVLDHTNAGSRDRDERRHLARYAAYAAALDPAPDLVVFGHIHTPVDHAATHPRLVVLGSWHEGGSYLKVDEAGAALIVEA